MQQEAPASNATPGASADQNVPQTHGDPVESRFEDLKTKQQEFQLLPKVQRKKEKDARVLALNAWRRAAERYYKQCADSCLGSDGHAKYQRNARHAATWLSSMADQNVALRLAAEELKLNPNDFVLSPPELKELQELVQGSEPEIAKDLYRQSIKAGLPVYGFKQQTGLSETPKRHWIPTVCFTGVLLLVLAAPLLKNDISTTEHQQDMANKLFTVFAGLSTCFMSGMALFTLEFPKNKPLRVAFTATAGMAVMAFVWVIPPYWFKSNALQNQPRIVPSPGKTLGGDQSSESKAQENQASMMSSPKEPIENDEFTEDEIVKLDRQRLELKQRLFNGGLSRNNEEQLRSKLLRPSWVNGCIEYLDGHATRPDFHGISFKAVFIDSLSIITKRKPRLRPRTDALRTELENAKEKMDKYSEQLREYAQDVRKEQQAERRLNNGGLFPPDNQNSGGADDQGGVQAEPPQLDEKVIAAFLMVRSTLDRLDELSGLGSGLDKKTEAKESGEADSKHLFKEPYHVRVPAIQSTDRTFGPIMQHLKPGDRPWLITSEIARVDMPPTKMRMTATTKHELDVFTYIDKGDDSPLIEAIGTPAPRGRSPLDIVIPECKATYRVVLLVILHDDLPGENPNFVITRSNRP